MNPVNIYSGPVSKIEIASQTDGTFEDLGAVAGGSAEITFEPKSYDLADGQSFQLYGLAKCKVEIAETDTSKLTLASAGKDHEFTKIRITAMDGKTYTTGPAIVQYSVKRGFGDEPHILTITQQKKVEDEDDFVTIA